MTPIAEQRDRVRRLQKACLYILDRCELVEQDWTHLDRLQQALPDICSTINQAMLAVMMITSDDREAP